MIDVSYYQIELGECPIAEIVRAMGVVCDDAQIVVRDPAVGFVVEFATEGCVTVRTFPTEHVLALRDYVEGTLKRAFCTPDSPIQFILEDIAK